nr:TMF-regulated nuclear protein 1-like [Aegilops tauschii subsp. strangulata]
MRRLGFPLPSSRRRRPSRRLRPPAPHPTSAPFLPPHSPVQTYLAPPPREVAGAELVPLFRGPPPPPFPLAAARAGTGGSGGSGPSLSPTRVLPSRGREAAAVQLGVAAVRLPCGDGRRQACSTLLQAAYIQSF